jgi:plasmid stabilization system protein ParE
VKYHVIFNEEARADLFGLYDFIARHSSSDKAAAYIERIREFCLSLQTFLSEASLRIIYGRGCVSSVLSGESRSPLKSSPAM